MTLKTHLSKKQYVDIVKKATKAAESYYNSDVLLTSDSEYDAMLKLILETERQQPTWIVDHKLHAAVAGGTSTETGAVHMASMLSLENCYSDADLVKWLESRNADSYTIEPKYDGLSLAATYTDGTLTRLATRGDGIEGENVTFAAGRIEGLPASLTFKGTFEVRGEIVFKKSNYDNANQARIATGKPAFANARNAAAGTLRSENLEYPVTLSFYAHGQVGLGQAASHYDSMLALKNLGINVNTDTHGLQLSTDADHIREIVKNFEQNRLTLDVDVDGMVVKVNKYEEQEILGNSSKAPRWGVAYKYPALEVMSKVEKVEWTVGRTGRITPRATITPVNVGGTIVTYATLHNAEDIARKDIQIGDTVLVKRAGEVIPRIEASIPALRDGTQSPVSIPQVCPRCSGVITTTDIIWRCVKGRECGLNESIEYAVSRDCLDIEGMGSKLISSLVKKQYVTNVADLFKLTAEQLSTCERMGELSVNNIMGQIEKAKNAPLDKVFCSLGVRGTGRSMSRRIAKHFKSMKTITEASINDFSTIDGIGIDKATMIHADLKELASVITNLASSGVSMPYGDSVNADKLKDKVFVVTGSMTGDLAGKSRQEVLEMIELSGGKTSNSVSSKTNYLVSGEKAGSKYNKALELKITILSPDELSDMLGSREQL